MLEKVSDSHGGHSPLRGAAIIFYAISLIVAFLAGGYYERQKAPVSPGIAAQEPTLEAQASATPAESVTAPPPPLASATPEPEAHFSPPALITSEPSASPTRIEKAIAVASPVVAAATAAPAIPVAAPSTAAAVAATPSPAPTVAKQPGAVTVTELVTDIPVKEAGKIVGYINLQPGAQIVPISVENGQIKFKSGDRFAYVPVKSTDMAH